MSKIKNKRKKSSVRTPTQEFNIEHALFSFKYLITNDNYTFKYFGKDSRAASLAYKGLINKLNEISQEDMSSILGKPKDIGIETLPYRQFNKPFQNILDGIPVISKDSKLTVLRFKAGDKNYRIICKSDLSSQNIMHIIGFDFDFSAYNHG